jgi:hypothetical protein
MRVLVPVLAHVGLVALAFGCFQLTRYVASWAGQDGQFRAQHLRALHLCSQSISATLFLVSLLPLTLGVAMVRYLLWAP